MLPPLETIPEHLQEYITEQQPELYSAMDQATWRYIMRVSKAFFSKTAHPLYGPGLEATGMSTERIPLISEMDAALRKMGWRAVAINGFIPPAIFLEFQALRILAIACDIRKLENLGYTPSPDIVHEAAGHAPIVADPGYRAYLESYGEVARNAIISKYDLDLYQAIFNLSEIKENPSSTPEQIQQRQSEFEAIAKKESMPSEAALLTRMAWWTTEYGLIEGPQGPLIYGAGLLSSVSESFDCLKPGVKKVPFSLEATIGTSYDITRPQPQLFVAKSFQQLTDALQKFANSMAFRRGGTFGLQVAKEAAHTVTVVLDTGIQVVGTVTDFEVDADGAETGFTLEGQKQIAFHDQAHSEFNQFTMGPKLYVPLFDSGVSSASSIDLQRKLHTSGLHTKSGHRITGRFKKEVDFEGLGKILVLENVKVVSSSGKLIFEEKQKPYPLMIGHRIPSVFGGAADRKEFALRNRARDRVAPKKVESHQTNLTPENTALNEVFDGIRKFRERGGSDLRQLETWFQMLQRIAEQQQKNQAPRADWLARLELLEQYRRLAPQSVYTAQLRDSLVELQSSQPVLKDLIQRGMELLT